MRLHLFTHIVLRLQIDLRSYQQLQAAISSIPTRQHGGCIAILHTQTNTHGARETERQTEGDKKGGKQAKTAKKKERSLTRKAAHILTA